MMTSGFVEVKVTVVMPLVDSVPVFLKWMLRSMSSPTWAMVGVKLSTER